MARRCSSLAGLLVSNVKGHRNLDGLGERINFISFIACRHLKTSGTSKEQSRQKQEPIDQSFGPNVVSHSDDELPFVNPPELLGGNCLAPTYRVLEKDGFLTGRLHSELTSQRIVELYKEMLFSNTIDRVMFECHRQGRISFYMTGFGEEATQFGSAAALEPCDWIFAQYREAGVLLHRGMPLNLMMAQCLGNKLDLGKGRQMPIHYGSRKHNFVTISSPLSTQMPQAAGAAYSMKLEDANKRDGTSRIVICYFGEGASSEGDAHAAMNFAATLDCPVIFFCRNNGYAISTPTREQFRSDGIVARGLGYGMSAIRVDGNDLFAVFAATRMARHICASEKRPVLIESMTYRVGHHSTSDDSSAYRSQEEINQWEQYDNPLKRTFNYLVRQNLWNEQLDKEARHKYRTDVIAALGEAEKLKKLPVESMFEDVYDDLPKNLQTQRSELARHLDQYGQHYPLKDHENSSN